MNQEIPRVKQDYFRHGDIWDTTGIVGTLVVLLTYVYYAINHKARFEQDMVFFF